jgi:hypothetical protein
MSKNWIAVASAEHVRLGRSQGFIQVSHGKAAPLHRIQPGDRVVFYSPTEAFRGKDRLRAFTAIGIVKEGEPHRAEMSGGFSPFRRDVAWQTAKKTPIEPLEFTSDKRNWAISCASACSRSAMPIWRGSRGPWAHRGCDSSQWPLDSASRSADAYSNVACSGG